MMKQDPVLEVHRMSRYHLHQRYLVEKIRNNYAKLYLLRGIRRKCTYEKGGLCHLHGPGAVCKWKPVIKTEMGEGGIIVRKKSREYFWVCDIGEMGVRRQTKLSFVQTQLSSRKLTPEDTSKTPDTEQGGEDSLRTGL